MACHGGPNISENGLVFSIDELNPRSNNGTEYKDIISKAGYKDTGHTYYESSDVPWATNIDELSFSMFIRVDGSNTGYASHAISKWSGTNTASFVLYHFHDYQGSSPQRADQFQWYANAGGVWGGISSRFYIEPGKTYHIGLQYSPSKGGQGWLNGVPIGSRVGSGTLASNGERMRINGGIDGVQGIHKVIHVSAYSREIADSEMRQHFDSFRDRFGI